MRDISKILVSGIYCRPDSREPISFNSLSVGVLNYNNFGFEGFPWLRVSFDQSTSCTGVCISSPNLEAFVLFTLNGNAYTKEHQLEYINELLIVPRQIMNVYNIPVARVLSELPQNVTHESFAIGGKSNKQSNYSASDFGKLSSLHNSLMEKSKKLFQPHYSEPLALRSYPKSTWGSIVVNKDLPAVFEKSDGTVITKTRRMDIKSCLAKDMIADDPRLEMLNVESNTVLNAFDAFGITKADIAIGNDPMRLTPYTKSRMNLFVLPYNEARDLAPILSEYKTKIEEFNSSSDLLLYDFSKRIEPQKIRLVLFGDEDNKVALSLETGTDLMQGAIGVVMNKTKYPKLYDALEMKGYHRITWV